MFEKESDAYIKKDGTKAEQIFTVLNKIDPLKITPTQAAFLLAVNRQVFQDAAEFGYTKGKAELEEVKCIINDLLDNSDEYARQRARDYLERG